MIQAGGVLGRDFQLNRALSQSQGLQRCTRSCGASPLPRLQRRQQSAGSNTPLIAAASFCSIWRRGSSGRGSPGIAILNVSPMEVSRVCSLRFRAVNSAALPATCSPTRQASRIAATFQDCHPTVRAVVGAYVPWSRFMGAAVGNCCPNSARGPALSS